MPEIIESPFRLNKGDPVVSAAAGLANYWSDIWTYQVPVGVSLILKPEHTLSVLFYAGGAVDDHLCMVRIEKRDASGSDVLKVYFDMYAASKEFQDQSLMARLQVPPEGIIINERELLVILGYDDGTIATATSYFELRIAKVRKALGA